MNRRSFLTRSAYATAFLGLCRHVSAAPAGRVIEPYGPLRPDPAGLLDLPEGFSYRILSKTGQRMTDGFKVPGKPDGMAAFAGPGGKVILVRNHELAVSMSKVGPFEDNRRVPENLARDRFYDPGPESGPPYLGGTTTLVLDPASGEVLEQFLSLTGTDRNCAGGPMPWGSWITCEEPEDLTSKHGLLHGYCFEVKAAPATGAQKPHALKKLGRFRHEAVALDPKTGILYLTEDRQDGLLYRFVPDSFTAGQPVDFDHGKLQALAIKGSPACDLRNYDPKGRQIPEGKAMDVVWIDLKDVESPKDDLRHRGFAAGAARFARGEGIFHDDGAIFICCTDGGPKHLGQIYKLTPGASDAITLFLQPGDLDLLTNGDNLTASPWGDLIICEDLVDHRSRKRAHIRGITPEGRIYTLARNALNDAEFAGSTFSPDGRTLFVNIQDPGHTFAITGPWKG